MNQRFRRTLASLPRTLFLAVLCVVMLYPFLWMISSSFKPVSELFVMPPTLIPAQPTLNNYRVVMEKMDLLGRMFVNSLIVSVSIPLLQIVTCSMAAYAFAKLRFPGKDVIFVIFLASMMIPSQVTIIPVYIIIKNLGLIDSIGSLILLGTFNMFFTFMLRQFFMSLPKELDDAARIDGCGVARSFLMIHMPLARSVIAVNAILTFNGAWGDFFGPLIFLKRMKNMTLPLGISLIQGAYSTQSQTVMIATLVVVILPVLIVFLFGRRHIIDGIATSGLKL